jgi:hypothetical protein
LDRLCIFASGAEYFSSDCSIFCGIVRNTVTGKFHIFVYDIYFTASQFLPDIYGITSGKYDTESDTGNCGSGCIKKGRIACAGGS